MKASRRNSVLLFDEKLSTEYKLDFRIQSIKSRIERRSLGKVQSVSSRRPANLEFPRFDNALGVMMMDAAKKTFVLVHGAWHGGWVWRDVVRRLSELGHTVTAPTLTGLGERRHTGNDSADLETHVEDVVALIEMENLQDITLVGWSYGGMVVTGVLARIPERIKELVYLDAFVPDDGEALADYWPPEVKEMMDTYRDRNAPLPALPLTSFGVSDPKVAKFVEPRLTAQPWRTCYQPVKALKVRPAIPISYIVCTGWGETPFTARLPEMKEHPGAWTTTLNASHLCMLTAAEDTVAALSHLQTLRQEPSQERCCRSCSD